MSFVVIGADGATATAGRSVPLVHSDWPQGFTEIPLCKIQQGAVGVSSSLPVLKGCGSCPAMPTDGFRSTSVICLHKSHIPMEDLFQTPGTPFREKRITARGPCRGTGVLHTEKPVPA